MDPVSAAASIVGLLGAASKVSESLIKFIRSVRGAPKLAQTVLLEVSDVSACLSQLQRYLLGSKANSRSHDGLLLVDQFVVALLNCVIIFSELEQIVDSLKPAHRMQAGSIARWALREKEIRALLQRLSSSQITLNLMLTTITCTSVEEARSSMDRLAIMMTKLLECNQDMSQRMAKMELRNMAYAPSITPTVAKADAPNIRSSPSPEVIKDDESLITIRQVGSDPSSEENDDALPTFDHSFDQDLNNSRPYTRASRRQPVWSVASSAVQTVSWSCYSGLSLADMSQISVINLPITPREIWNGQRYFGCAESKRGLDDIVEEESRSGAASSASSRSAVKSRSSSILSLKRFLKAPDPLSPGQQRDILSQIDIGTPARVCKRVILLGGSFSGKTTIYHHMLMLHGSNISEIGRLDAREGIINDLINAFKMTRLDLGRISPGVFFETIDSEPFDVLELATENGHFNNFYTIRCHGALKSLWQRSEVRDKVLSGRNATLNENIPFIMDNIDQLFIHNDAISDELLLRVRNKRAGIDSKPVMVDDVQTEIYDVGGTRFQRQDWKECFTDLDSIIYVVSLTGYYRKLLDDECANEMERSLAMFESLTKTKRVKKLPIILLLNKVDILEQEIRKKPVSDYFATCPRDADCKTACRYFSDQFARLDERHNGALHIYVTSAVDRFIFKKTLDAIRPIITRNERKRSPKGRSISSPVPLSSTSQQGTEDLICHLILGVDLATGNTRPKSAQTMSTESRTPPPQVKTLQPFHSPMDNVLEPSPLH